MDASGCKKGDRKTLPALRCKQARHKTKLTTRMRRGYCMKTTISLEAQLGKFAMVDI